MQVRKRKWYWTRQEENYLLNADGPDEEIAWTLGRTIQAVRHKRCRLLRRPT